MRIWPLGHAAWTGECLWNSGAQPFPDCGSIQAGALLNRCSASATTILLVLGKYAIADTGHLNILSVSHKRKEVLGPANAFVSQDQVNCEMVDIYVDDGYPSLAGWGRVLENLSSSGNVIRGAKVAILKLWKIQLALLWWSTFWISTGCSQTMPQLCIHQGRTSYAAQEDADQVLGWNSCWSSSLLHCAHYQAWLLFNQKLGRFVSWTRDP